MAIKKTQTTVYGLAMASVSQYGGGRLEGAVAIITRWRALRQDLKKHVIAGAALGLVFTLAVGAMLAWAAPLLPAWWPPQANPIFAALIGFAAAERIGWGKEYLWDASGRGNVDRDDYLYTGRAALLGAVVGMLALFALQTFSPWSITP